MKVKICGITNEADARVAIAAGADALGFITYPKSKRFITPEVADDLAGRFPVMTVAVAVNPTEDELAALVGFNVIQLHGDESPELVQSLGYRQVIKALPATRETVDSIEKWGTNLAAFLLDTPSAAYGGTGQVFDWELAVELKKRTPVPVILSGGLSPENVAEAIERVQPYAVDVCSGVESAPGKKDHAKLREFIQICKRFP